MKKLMITACAIAFAAVSQAATINWGSGYLKAPTSATDGTAGGSLLGSVAKSSWTATLYIYSDAAGTTQVAYDTVTMNVDASKGKTFVQGATDKDANGTIATTYATPAGIKVTGARWDDLDLNTTYYAKVVVEGTTADYTAKKTSDLFTFTTKESPTTAVDVGSSNAAKWPTSYTGGAWTVTAVPEPTSGLLLLLGVAGLALKRKRA